MSDDLLRWRSEFPICDTTTYLVSHSLGAMPRRAEEKLLEYTRTWATRGVRAWHEGWWDSGVTIGDLVGRIIGAEPGSVSMHQNVTVASAVALSCFEFRGRRNKIVITDTDFPSVVYLHEAQRRCGARVVRLPADDGVSVPLERLLAAIDEETALVPVSHVLYKSARIQDAAAIVERAHRVGATVVLDVYQAAGTVPLNVTALGVDMAVGGSVKWLCGGPGAGYLYVRPDLARRLEPALTGWAAHAAPFGFETGPIRYAHGARKFLNGTPNVPALYAASAGYEIIAEIGVDAIRAKSLRLTGRLIDLARERGFTVRTPREDAIRGGTVTIDVPHSGAVAEELLARQFIIDWRPEAGIRVSPHFYTREDEMDAVVAEIENILATRAYERHLASL